MLLNFLILDEPMNHDVEALKRWEPSALCCFNYGIYLFYFLHSGLSVDVVQSKYVDRQNNDRMQVVVYMFVQGGVVLVSHDRHLIQLSQRCDSVRITQCIDLKLEGRLEQYKSDIESEFRVNN